MRVCTDAFPLATLLLLFVCIINCSSESALIIDNNNNNNNNKRMSETQLQGHPLNIVSAEPRMRYVHLSFTQIRDEMVIGWYTEDPIAVPQVKYGLSSQHYIYSAGGGSNSWKKGYGYNHFVILTHLQQDTLYYYICGDGQEWSQEYTFTSQPLPNTTKSFSIGIYGDMGIDNSQNTINGVITHAKNNEIDWIFHVGDIGYADDHVLSFQKTWNKWFSMVEAVSATHAYMVGPGNHEYASYDPLLYHATKNFVVYNHRFLMPHANNQSQSMYYSFDYANVHFISYSTETSFPGAPFGKSDDFANELSWLENDLIQANKNRKQTPWIIVVGHRPIYSSCVGYSKDGKPIDSRHPPSNSLTLQKVFEDLFHKYKVDIIFNGHVHSYERNYPTYRNKRTSDYVNPKSPFNIVIGCAGNMEGLENKHESHWNQPQPEWSAHRYGDDYGYGILTVNNNTHLHWQFFRAEDGGLEDEVMVINEHSFFPV